MQQTGSRLTVSLCATEWDKALFDENVANFDENAANAKQADCKFMFNRVGQSFVC